MSRVRKSDILRDLGSGKYRQRVERDRSKYHRPSEPHTVVTEQHEPGCDLLAGGRLCSCSPYLED